MRKKSTLTINEYLGIALGCIGLSYSDFCLLTFDEFEAVYKAYADRCEFEYKDNWMRTRTVAYIGIQPHIDKKHKITPDKLLPFPWDQKATLQRRRITPQEQRERMKLLEKRLAEKEL